MVIPLHSGWPRFFFTCHPQDMLRSRIIRGSSVMVVAAAHWDDDKKRFRIKRPPPDWIYSLAIDSGGFTAAARWGKYPWTVTQYVDFIYEMIRYVHLDFCAIMDYACERLVNRGVYATNIERINATIENAISCHLAAPDLPWLDVFQGNTFAERTYDLERRAAMNWPLRWPYVGLGSVCRRSPKEGRKIIRFYDAQGLDAQYHVFGGHVQILDDAQVFSSVRSWDSYSWNWGKGTNLRKDARQPGETYTAMTRRFAWTYWSKTIVPRLRAQQIKLPL